MDRDSTIGEARARYTASAISGTVMMLSDDYERPEARKRAKTLASNREINDIARFGAAFCPVSSHGSSASEAYTAVVNGKHCLAVFHWKENEEDIEIDCARAGVPSERTWRELWSGTVYRDEQGILRWHVCGCDAIVLAEEDESGCC